MCPRGGNKRCFWPSFDHVTLINHVTKIEHENPPFSFFYITLKSIAMHLIKRTEYDQHKIKRNRKGKSETFGGLCKPPQLA